MRFLFQLLIFLTCFEIMEAKVTLGIDRIFEADFVDCLKGKKVGLITNQTGVNSSLVSTIEILQDNQKKYNYVLSCLFAPEHGLYGEVYAGEIIDNGKTKSQLTVYSLHGVTRRPTKQMLQGLQTLIFDIQDIGARSYTYCSTLFYTMEEAAKRGIEVIVCDRPNPIGGVIVDGPMLEKEFRSFVGYINVPYCHGMTIGELAQFFNSEYKIGCRLKVIPMSGWTRQMSFEQTGLQWIPTSPNIPNPTAAFCYPLTGMLGELEIASIGIGYTLPFQIVAAPWIDAKQLASVLNRYKLPGVHFTPTYVKPFFGRYAKQTCQGVLLLVTNTSTLRPFSVQCAIFHGLRRCYPKTFQKLLLESSNKREFFNKVIGTKSLSLLLVDPLSTFEQMCAIHKKERDEFLKTRKKYLLY